MKTLLFITVILLASCSSDDPEPQAPCETLQVQLNAAQKAIIDHQATGSNGNPEAWKYELKKLTTERDRIQGEFIRRAC